MSSPLRQQFTDYLTIMRYAPKTKEAYLNAVTGLARHTRQSPDVLCNEQIQEYLRYLIEDSKFSWSTCNVVFSGLQCFYSGFLKWEASRFSIPPRPRMRKIPMILSSEEVRVLLDSITNLKHRALLLGVYSAGLRVSEVVNLKPEHIESSPSRMLIRVEQGKGRKDRYTLLSEKFLITLRKYYHIYQPQEWLFPSRDPHKPMPVDTVQRIYYAAKKKPA